ncbi:MAG: orotidine-5'-phosphate decarboxylase [Acidobacteriota bacterium]|jgi:orotidine-5'-phosphate decarboxylase
MTTVSTSPSEITESSNKEIPVEDRLIFPLDVTSFDQAKKLVDELGDSVQFYKLGLELLLAGGGFSGEYISMVDWLVERGKKVLVDIKIFDIPRTVEAAVQQLRGHGATFVTVHGNDEILAAAVRKKNGVKVLAVTVLTSLDEKDMEDLGFRTDIKSLVLSRARRAFKLGCDGVISSGLEASALRQDLGRRFLIVVPGVRPGKNREDDQKRVVDIEEAFGNGADYIIVGRPIRNAPDPRRAAEEIQRRIREYFQD